MATTIATSAGKTTITIKYAFEAVKMAEVLDSVAQGLYTQRGQWAKGLVLPPTYAEMTAKQKLELLDAYIKFALTEVHRQRLLKVAQDVYEIAATAAYQTGTVELE